MFGDINFVSGDATVEVDFVGELVADFEGGGLFDGGLELDFEVVFVEGLVVMFSEAGVGGFEQFAAFGDIDTREGFVGAAAEDIDDYWREAAEVEVIRRKEVLPIEEDFVVPKVFARDGEFVDDLAIVGEGGFVVDLFGDEFVGFGADTAVDDLEVVFVFALADAAAEVGEVEEALDFFVAGVEEDVFLGDGAIKFGGDFAEVFFF